MSNSALVSATIWSPNHSGPRTHTIDRITPHCVVGQCTIEGLGNLFANPSRYASSNYGIGADGRIGLYVDEGNRSWCSSSNSNDQRAITIECASDTYYPYEMNSKVYQSLIKLCADICRRNGKTKLLWLGDANTALNYSPKSNEMVLTAHRWFAATACPGEWLYTRLGDLATQVTKLLQPVEPKTTPQPTPTPTPKPTPTEEEEEEVTQAQFNEMMNTWLQEKSKENPGSWSANSRQWAETNGLIKGDEKGRKMYHKFLTREEFVEVLYRALKDK